MMYSKPWCGIRPPWTAYHRYHCITLHYLKVHSGMVQRRSKSAQDDKCYSRRNVDRRHKNDGEQVHVFANNVFAGMGVDGVCMSARRRMLPVVMLVNVLVQTAVVQQAVE